MRRYLVSRNLSGWRFAYRTFSIVDRAEVPGHLLELMQSQGWQLEQLGFQYQTCFRSEVSIVPNEFTWTLVFAEAATGDYALVDMSEEVTRFGLAELSYITFFSDEKVLLTTGRASGAQGDHPKMERIVARVEESRELHRSRVEVYATPERGPVTFSPEDLAVVLSAYVDRHIDILVSEKRLKAGKQPNSWRMTFPEAWKSAGVVLKNVAETKKKQSAGPQIPAGPPPIPASASYRNALAEFEVDMFFYCRKVGAIQGGTGWDKLIILLASIGLFLLWLGFEASLQTIAIVFVVLLVHESGHLFGMWMFRYRNLQMLFLPFFGAVAMGAREQVKPWQELIVLLLGPIPGLAAAFVMLFTMGPYDAMPSWMQETVATLFILNGFNLLPIYPMDGGQLVRLAFFTRFPRLGALFSLISGLLLVGLGLLAGTWGLAILAVLMLSSTGKNFRAASIVNSVREAIRNPPAASEREVARAVLCRIAEPISNLKFQLATPPFLALITPVAGFGTASIVALLYLSPLWLPFAAWPILQWQGEERLERAQAELARLRENVSPEVPAKAAFPELEKEINGKAGDAALPLAERAYARFGEEEEGDNEAVKRAADAAYALPSTKSLLTGILSAAAEVNSKKVSSAEWYTLNNATSILVGAALLEAENGDRTKAWEYLIAAQRLESMGGGDLLGGWDGEENVSTTMKAIEWFLLSHDWPTEAEIQKAGTALPDSVSWTLRLEAILLARRLQQQYLFDEATWGWLSKTPVKVLNQASYLEASAELSRLRGGTEEDLRKASQKYREAAAAWYNPAMAEAALEVDNLCIGFYRFELLRSALDCYGERVRTGTYPATPANSDIRWKDRSEGRYILHHVIMPELEFEMKPENSGK